MKYAFCRSLFLKVIFRAYLAFQSRHGNARDEIFLRKNVQRNRREQGDHGPGHDDRQIFDRTAREDL